MMMKVLVTLLVLGCYFLHENALGQESKCKKVNSCSCTLPDNKVIDLSPLALQNGSARWRDQWDPMYFNTYSYNPCYSFSEGDCTNAAVCQYARDKFYVLGTQDSAEFVDDNITDQLFLKYTSTDGQGSQRVTEVVLECSKNNETDFEVLGEPAQLQYRLKLTSPHCCPKSTGNSKCTKVNSCSCSFEDDKVIDLSPLASKDGSPRWKDQWDPMYYNQYSYNPCYSFSEDRCINASVCQFADGNYYKLGSQESAEFIQDPHSGQLFIAYNSVDELGVNRTTEVVLECDPKMNNTVFEALGEPVMGQYRLKLTGPYSCPRSPKGQIY